MTVLLVILVVVVLVVFVVISIYNGLVRKRANVQEAWSSVDVFLKKRNDLIPNLVETVKGYALHESSTLQKVIEARQLSTSASSPTEQIKAEKTMQNAMMNLFAVAENYPDLEANTNFIALQQDLNSMEDDIEMARRYYNGMVKENNIAVESFPSNIIANMFKFSKSEFFEIENKVERESVKVSF
ncbi:LemA family protein [Riemerella anatipestifer]|uniref:LemA family protein n=1 Tax=Riemerella anatipestifer TaxID=34085 RepID=UPI00129D6C6A|nr:LemA family protein [Riemerella anatipestifer]MRM82343.1 LemA family protein [Riemerella anatipestifer]